MDVRARWQLKGTPDFAGVCDFDRSANGLVPLECAISEKWVFARTDAGGPSLDDFLGADLSKQLHALGPGRSALDGAATLHDRLQLEGLRRQLSRWRLSRAASAQWPRQRPGLQRYTIETGERFCLQSSPMVQGRRRSADGSSTTGRPRILLLDLSELHDQLLRWCDGYQPGDSSQHR